MPKGQPGTKAPHGTSTRYDAHGCRCEACRVARREYQGERLGLRPREVVDAERAAQHETESKYTAGCRCGPCTFAANEARAERRRTGEVRTHNHSGYSNGCRCDICRAAHAAYTRDINRRRRKATA